MKITEIGKNGTAWVSGHNKACNFTKKTIDGSKRCSAVEGQGFRHQVQRIGNTDKFRVMTAPEEFPHRLGQELAMINAPAKVVAAPKSTKPLVHSLKQGNSTWIMRVDFNGPQKLINRNAEMRASGDIQIKRGRNGFVVLQAPRDLKEFTKTVKAPKPQKGLVYVYVFRLTAGTNQ